MELSRVALVISLSVNVFLLASLATYGIWIVAHPLSTSLRGLVSLIAWIVFFGSGTLAFWKVIDKLSASS